MLMVLPYIVTLSIFHSNTTYNILLRAKIVGRSRVHYVVVIIGLEDEEEVIPHQKIIYVQVVYPNFSVVNPPFLPLIDHHIPTIVIKDDQELQVVVIIIVTMIQKKKMMILILLIIMMMIIQMIYYPVVPIINHHPQQQHVINVIVKNIQQQIVHIIEKNVVPIQMNKKVKDVVLVVVVVILY